MLARVVFAAVFTVAAILACATATKSIAQSPELCVAYMEAFASRNAARESIYAKHGDKIQAAYKRAKDAERAAWKSAHACESHDVESWKRCNRRFEAIPKAEDDPDYRLAYKKKDLELEQLEKTFHQSLLNIYDGPTSENHNVLWTLVDQDITRCHHGGFPMPR